MTTEGGHMPGHGWLDRPLDDSCPPRKRELALALRDLFRLLKQKERIPGKSDKSEIKPLNQAGAAKRLNSNSTSLSRIVNHDPNNPRVPDQGFVTRLYEAACADAAADQQEVPFTLEALLDLRTSAEGERRGCKHCVELGKRIDSLTQRTSVPCPSCAAREREREEERGGGEDSAGLAAAKSEASALRASVEGLKASEAGLQVRLAMAKASRPPLPVPLQRGDRQRSEQERAVARQLAAHAAELDGAGKQDSALTLLRQGTTELLNPSETALVMVELRQQERDHLADNLIHVYGRDQGDRQVMEVALELHAEGAVADAGAILRAALR
ncbi:hypothetical protein ACFY30_37770 [Streptomyces sp. NPDC000345]|uniref:hypothetical protein n=1 Tax=Streptomyces sp. NPDC000345 TaxID=3364537 RepID=UPI00367A7051